MFEELIYTRCRQGIDILTGRTVSGGGLNVYACTPSLHEAGNTYLRFLLDVAQWKQSYKEPDFMDDAYLYFVVDNGGSIMLEFHPIPLDKTATGNYSHRRGNYLNHVLVGDYSSFYPFELFRDNAVWNAKTRGEAYYYENAPTELLPRTDISDPSGPFGIEEIGAFISDGRADAFMRAVSFLIAQYELPPEERKYLVIRDESSEKIELWIAAIEHAFSPRMAAGLPFATRMDEFKSANRYAVNQMGVYQPQKNFQDESQKLRCRAMIIGVDERDRTNAAAARTTANSPFVLLDGKEKRALFEADISNAYFQFITGFNEVHQSFCREFLQMINITEPSADVYRLLDIFKALENTLLPNAEDMGKIVSLLGKYTLFDSTKLQNIYARITAELPQYLREDPRSTLQIIKWLQATARTVNDTGANLRLTDIVCKVFTEQMCKSPDSEGAFDFWRNIKNSEFASSVAGYFVDPAILQANKPHLRQFEFQDIIMYVFVYLDCAAYVNSDKEQDLQGITNWGLQHCCKEDKTDAAYKILDLLTQNQRVNVQDVLFSIAKGAENDYAEFIINLLIKYDNSIVSSDVALAAFLKKLSAEKMEHLAVVVLKDRAYALSGTIDIVAFIKLLKKAQFLTIRDMSELFMALDRKLTISEKDSMNAAVIIQREKPKEAACVNSAHLYALEVLNDKRSRAQFTKIYNELIPQKFPSVTNPEYIAVLTDKLFKARLEERELVYIVHLFSRVPEYISELVNFILGITTPKKNDEWYILISVAAKAHDRGATFNAIVEECAKLKQGEKALAQLSDMLDTKETQSYFKQIAEKARVIIRSQKPQSGFGKLFGKISGNDAAIKGGKK
jgi:hypothetical protein